MNLRFRNGQYCIWHSRKEWPPAGKLATIESILGEKITTKKEAEAFLRTYKQERKNLKQENLFNLPSDRIQLSELQTGFTTGERADLSRATLANDHLALQTLIDVVGDRSVCAIRKPDLVEMKNACLDRGLSPHTVRTYFRHLKAALNWAKNQGVLQTVPEFPQVKAPTALPQIIQRRHLKRIMAYTKKNHFEIWRYAQFALNTGCRISEAKTLQWQNVQIYSQPTPGGIVGRARLTGKGDKQRTVPLIPDALKAVEAGGRQNVGPVFLQWLATTISKKFKLCVRQTALKSPEAERGEYETYHFHSLRHTAATNMVEKGIQLETIQKILGHADIATTQIYAKVLDHFVEDEMSKMIGKKL